MNQGLPNILFIVLDTVRAKSLSLLNSDTEVYNNVQSLAADGEMFSSAIAPSAWTLPSHVSMFTGQIPSDHGVVRPGSLFDPEGSLPRQLATEGYHTLGVSANPFVGPRNGFAEAFHEFHHVIPTPTTSLFKGGRDALQLARTIDSTGIRKVTAAGSRIIRGKTPGRTAANLLWYKLSLKWSQRQRRQQRLSGGPQITDTLENFFNDTDEPFFAFANYMEAHGPYCAPEEYIDQHYPKDVDLQPDEVELDPWAHIIGEERHSESEIKAARGLYQAAIGYLDDQIGEILDALESAGMRDDTIVIVTSDHGEAFGERGRLDHNCLYQPVTRVPLVIDHPGREPNRRTEPVSLRSLFPTLLHAAGIEDHERESLFGDSPTSHPVITQYLDLHVHNLERRFERSAIDPFEERLQSAFGTDYQLLIGNQGTEELIPFDGSVQPVTGHGTVRNRLRKELPPFPTNREDSTRSSGGPDEELLRSLGYLE